MAEKNVVSQTVRLISKPYTDGIAAIRTASRSAVTAVNKELFSHKVSWQDVTNEVKRSSASIGKELTGLSKGFASSLGKGALLGGAGMAASLVRQSYAAGTASTLEFSKNLQHLSFKAGLAESKVESLRKRMMDLGRTGVQLESLPKALSELYAYTKDADKAAAVLEPVAQAAAIGDGNAADVAKFVSEHLAGSGKEVNKANATELLNSVAQTLKGGNFKDIGEVMGAYSSMDADKLRQSKLSSKEYGALLAAGSTTGGSREQSAAAINALISGANTGFAGNAVLQGLLGANLFKGGKVNLGGFEQASKRMKGMGLNDAQMKALLQETAGLSESEATGLMAILRNVDKFRKGVEDQRRSTDTLASSYAKATDNLSDNLQRLQNQIEAGVGNLLRPLEKPFNKLLKGDVSGALGDLPGAAGGLGKAVVENPGTVAAGVAATAAAGALAAQLSKTFLGGKGGALSGALGMGKNLAIGAALKQAGVTPVYVVNANELAQAAGGSSGIDWTGGLYKGGGAAGGAAAASRLAILSRLGLMGAAAGGGIWAGLKLNEMSKGTKLDTEIMAPLADHFIMALQKVGFFEQWQRPVRVEVTSKDPALSAKPKASDNSRDARGP